MGTCGRLTISALAAARPNHAERRARLVERMVEPVDGAELVRMADDHLMAGGSIAQKCSVKRSSRCLAALESE